MGLTISNWGNVASRNMTPQDAITANDWNQLGKGLGGLQRWSQREKAADLMEGKANAMDRIKEIDTEIAELEGQLNTIQQGQDAFRQAREQQEIAAQNRADAQQGMAGYQPNSVLSNPAQPENVTSIYGEQYLATPQFDRSNSQYGNQLVEDRYAYDQALKARQQNSQQNAMNKYRWGR